MILPNAVVVTIKRCSFELGSASRLPPPTNNHTAKRATRTVVRSRPTQALNSLALAIPPKPN